MLAPSLTPFVIIENQQNLTGKDFIKNKVSWRSKHSQFVFSKNNHVKFYSRLDHLYNLYLLSTEIFNECLLIPCISHKGHQYVKCQALYGLSLGWELICQLYLTTWVILTFLFRTKSCELGDPIKYHNKFFLAIYHKL